MWESREGGFGRVVISLKLDWEVATRWWDFLDSLEMMGARPLTLGDLMLGINEKAGGGGCGCQNTHRAV